MVERVATSKQTVSVKGSPREQTQTKTSRVSITLKAKTASTFILAVKFETLTFAVVDEHPAVNLKAGKESDVAQDEARGRLTVSITPQGKMLKLDGYDAFIAKCADKNPEERKNAADAAFGRGGGADMEELFSFLPERPVRAGDKWKHEANEPIPPLAHSRRRLIMSSASAPGTNGLLAMPSNSLINRPARMAIFCAS